MGGGGNGGDDNGGGEGGTRGGGRGAWWPGAKAVGVGVPPRSMEILLESPPQGGQDVDTGQNLKFGKKFGPAPPGLARWAPGRGAGVGRGARSEEGGLQRCNEAARPTEARPPPAAMPVYSRLVQDIDMEEEAEIQRIAH